MNRIGFKEEFLLYIYIDHRRVDKLIAALRKQKFRVFSKDLGDDHEVSVPVIPSRAAEVVSIFNLYK